MENWIYQEFQERKMPLGLNKEDVLSKMADVLDNKEEMKTAWEYYQKLVVVREEQVIKRWACPVNNLLTLKSDLEWEGKEYMELYEIETPYEEEKEFRYSSPSFGPSVGMEQGVDVVTIGILV